MSKGWRNDSHRHSLASRGIQSTLNVETPISIPSYLCEYKPIEKGEIEPLIYPVIKILEEKGYETRYSCQGHSPGEYGSQNRKSYGYEDCYITFRTEPELVDLFESCGFEIEEIGRPRFSEYTADNYSNARIHPSKYHYPKRYIDRVELWGHVYDLARKLPDSDYSDNI